MAKKRRKLHKKKGCKNWISVFQWRDKNHKKVYYTKSLATPDKELAWMRYDEIDDRVDDLKTGIRFKWSWERQSSRLKVEIHTVQDAFDKYLKSQESNGLKPDTIQGTKDAYRRLMESKCASPSLPIKSLKGIVLDDFKAYWLGKHSPNTISQSLNKIKAFLNYCVDKRWMSNYKSVQSPLKAKPISYFTDAEFKSVMDAMASDELRRAMLFYRETGCRKREPFISRRVGNTLIIPPMKKNPVERRVQLSDVMCKVHDEMVDRFNQRMLKCKSEKAGWDWYYIKLKQACKVVGIDHKTLHDLRDTFIIRLWAVTGDIHMVSTMVGHTDIKQTVEYARFTPPELLVHFPSLEKWLKPRLEVANSLMDGRLLDGSEYKSLAITNGEWSS
jgi:integrase